MVEGEGDTHAQEKMTLQQVVQIKFRKLVQRHNGSFETILLGAGRFSVNQITGWSPDVFSASEVLILWFSALHCYYVATFL